MQSRKSLKFKTIHGMGWSAIDNVSKLGITFVVGVILARLLSPDEYGLIGILTIFITVFNTVVDSGFTSALIRKKEATDADYSTAFYTNLVISIAMAGLLFVCARSIADFFGRYELVAMTQVLSCVIVINAFSIVQRVRLTRRVDFKTQTKVTVIATVVSGILGISMAYSGFGVWALVVQQISLQLIISCLLWYYNRWIPSLTYNWKSFHEMWSFGWKLLVSGLLESIWKEINQVVIGKCYSPATLGLYTRASHFCDLPSSNLTKTVQRVSYPVLSSIRDDKVRLKGAYKRVIRTTMFPTFVLMLGMAASAKSMVMCLIGPQWLGCVLMLQIICSYMMLYPLHAINLNMLQVQGRSDLFLKLEIIKKLIAIPPLLLGIFVSIYWMLVGSFVAGLFAYYLNAYYSGPFLNYSISEQIKDILPSFGIALAMAVPVYLISLLPLSAYILLPLQIIVGAAIVFSLCEITKLSEYLELKSIVLKSFGKAKRH